MPHLRSCASSTYRCTSLEPIYFSPESTSPNCILMTNSLIPRSCLASWGTDCAVLEVPFVRLCIWSWARFHSAFKWSAYRNKPAWTSIQHTSIREGRHIGNAKSGKTCGLSYFFKESVLGKKKLPMLKKFRQHKFYFLSINHWVCISKQLRIFSNVYRCSHWETL